jgi:hypothetical protein
MTADTWVSLTTPSELYSFSKNRKSVLTSATGTVYIYIDTPCYTRSDPFVPGVHQGLGSANEAEILCQDWTTPP